MKDCQKKKLKLAPLQHNCRSKEGWSPMEGDGEGSWTSCSENQWESAQLPQWPSPKRKKVVWNPIHLPSVLLCRILPGWQFPQGVILCCWSMCWRGRRLQGRGSLGMGEVSQCSKSGSTDLGGLKAFGFNKEKIQSFFTFPGESSLSLAD